MNTNGIDISLPATRAAIAALIPHQDAMCLLERVIHFDANMIECRTRSHLDAGNPLRTQGRIAALHLCEYGAQAAAVHGALLGRQSGMKPAAGLLVALRDVRLTLEYLDECAELALNRDSELIVIATQLNAGAAGCAYAFSIGVNEHRLAEGRATIMNEPAMRSSI